MMHMTTPTFFFSNSALRFFASRAHAWATVLAFTLCALLTSVTNPAHARAASDPKAAPNDFVQAVGNNALQTIKNDEAVKRGDLNRINQLVDELIMPYVNFEKTTRLAAGRHWRQASPEQQKALIDAFRGTLIR